MTDNFSFWKPIVFLYGLLIALASCGIGRKAQPQNIGDRYEVGSTAKGSCRAPLYLHKDSGKKLNGRYRLEPYANESITATFVKGEPEDTLWHYASGELIEKTTYHKGLKHGRSWVYSSGTAPGTDEKHVFLETSDYENGIRNGVTDYFENGVRTHSAVFKDGRKDGTETYFNEQGDTLGQLQYAYDPSAIEPPRDQTLPSDLSAYVFKGRIAINGTLPVGSDFFLLHELVAAEPLCPLNTYYIVGTATGSWLCFYSPIGLAYKRPF